MQLQDHPFDFPDKGDCCFRNLNYIQNMVGLDGCNILKRILVMMTSGDMHTGLMRTEATPASLRAFKAWEPANIETRCQPWSN
jgi:hypothetical protein